MITKEWHLRHDRDTFKIRMQGCVQITVDASWSWDLGKRASGKQMPALASCCIRKEPLAPQIANDFKSNPLLT